MKTPKKFVKPYIWIIGIDEVGRGPIAGPVTVCACAIRADNYKDMQSWNALNDSKKMTKYAREAWHQKAMQFKKEGFIDYAVSSQTNKSIDAKGISNAIKQCIARTLKELALNPSTSLVLLDGSLKAPVEYAHQRTIIKGDLKEKIISLASVIAKVSRDKTMDSWHKKYPHYGWNTNKGYGTRKHYESLDKEGVHSLHRLTYLAKLKK